MSKTFKNALLVVASAAALSQLAYAQDTGTAASDDQAVQDTVTVIGSRRPGRTAIDSNVPIDVIGSANMESVGFTDVNRQLQNLVPSFNFPQPSLVDGTEHIKPASLRGLAPDQTLVLVNGRRRHSTSQLNINGSAGRGSVSVDMNSIPSSAIDHIEVLRDGAAAQYGSDAIGGVINIVTRDAAEGGQLSITTGMHITTLDGVPEMTGVAVGADGYPVANGSNRVQGVYGDDIERQDGETVTVAYNQGFSITDDGYLNVTLEYMDAARTDRGGLDDGDTYALLPNGEFDPREITVNRDRFFVGNPETTAFTGLISSGYEISETAELYAMTSFQRREATSGAFFREASDEAFGIQDIYPDGFTPRINSDISDYAAMGGIRGEVGGWNYDTSLVWGRNRIEYTNTNTANVTYLSATPTTFYGGGTEMTQTTLNADFSRLFDVDMFASPISVAFGAEYRNEEYSIFSGDAAAYTNNPLLDANGDIVYDANGNPVNGDANLAVGSHAFAQGSIYFSQAAEVDESRAAVGLYGEVDFDITDPWNVTLAGRFEDYDDFGDTFNVKAATRYELTDSFAVRASASTGFRAPSLQQQYYTSVTTNFINGEAFDIGTLPATSDAAMALGGTQLQPEESTNYSIGATWTGIPDLTITVDAYRIEINDRVVLSETLGDSADEAAIVSQVFADAGIQGVGAARFFINGVDSTTEGVDVTASYSMGLGDMGDLNLIGGLNYNSTEVSDVIATVGPASLFGPDALFARRERARLENAAPEIKANFTANWSWEDFASTFRVNYYGDVTQPGTTSAGDVTIDPAFIIDLEASYQFNERVNVAVGGNNIFDVYPESSVEAAGGVTNAGQFDFIAPYPGFSSYGFQGRYVYARLSIDL
ncbi:TonB-dependent receptor [Ponticaulis sp.]|uniref:TonB-dependent receptor plug domain-containing protein n=1 Tax=Ponticaulis sp. TaxID=2020902 RepID=UPI0026010B44|nr:TonB-dependent receptor [Ponticaulis sp.]